MSKSSEAVSVKSNVSASTAPDRAPAFAVDAAALHGVLKAALLWVSEDGTRPHLNCVRVEVDGSEMRVVSTNGHGLYFAELNSGVECEVSGAYSLRVATVEALVKATKSYTAKKAPPAKVTFGEKSASVCDVVIMLNAVEGDEPPFPPYWRVIPARHEKSVAARGVDLRYLGMVAKSFPGCTGTRMETGGELDPIVFYGANGDGLEARVVLMPMRI
jgi:hypothetical protein